MKKRKRPDYETVSAINSNSSFIATEEFSSCDTCVNGKVTSKFGVICGKNLALSCKPGLLESPKHYQNWESEIEAGN